MKSWLKICLQTAWLSTAISILVMGTSLCVATDEACFQSGDSMMFLMFWLTFPCGVLFLLVSEIFLDGGGTHFPSDFITVWMILMCGGLVQWFVLVPRLFEKRKFVTLDLVAAAPTSLPGSIKALPEMTQSLSVLSEAASVELAVETARPEIVKINRVRRSTSRPSNNSFAPFDRKGRTPLERVISHS